MLWAFASQDEKTSRAVQHARILKIKGLSPMMGLYLAFKFFPIPQPDEPKSQDQSLSPPNLIRRLASAISSLKQRFK